MVPPFPPWPSVMHDHDHHWGEDHEHSCSDPNRDHPGLTVRVPGALLLGKPEVTHALTGKVAFILLALFLCSWKPQA